jgi:hypothetical protein
MRGQLAGVITRIQALPGRRAPVAGQVDVADLDGQRLIGRQALAQALEALGQGLQHLHVHVTFDMDVGVGLRVQELHRHGAGMGAGRAQSRGASKGAAPDREGIMGSLLKQVDAGRPPGSTRQPRLG